MLREEAELLEPSSGDLLARVVGEPLVTSGEQEAETAEERGSKHEKRSRRSGRGRGRHRGRYLLDVVKIVGAHVEGGRVGKSTS